MRKKIVPFSMLLVLGVVLFFSVVASAEVLTSENFTPESLVVSGVALAPLISILISILKGWVKLDSKYIPLINVILGTIAVFVVGIVNEGMTVGASITMTLGVVFGSQVFHETFGHAGKALQELVGKKPSEE